MPNMKLRIDKFIYLCCTNVFLLIYFASKFDSNYSTKNYRYIGIDFFTYTH